MACKSMAVYLDADARSAERRDFALRLAKAHGASLTAFQLEHLVFDSPHEHEGRASAALQYEHDVRQRRMQQRAAFSSAATDQGVEHAWFLVRQPELDAAVTLAREFDLLIIGQKSDSQPARGHGFDALADRLLLASGRPVLLAPATGRLPTAFSHIVVAWNGGRESVRALADALPLLAQAGHISLIVAPPRHPSTELPQPDPLAWLRRQGITAEVSTLACASGDTEALLAELAQLQQADLLVAGAYGHSRVGEIVFGGATRAMLRSVTIPLLMSH
jgi:nucleotide-binding universal stress UspA family protein